MMFGHAVAIFLTINSSSNHRNRRSRGASDRQSCTTSPRPDRLEVGYQDEKPRSGGTPVASTIAASTKHEVPTALSERNPAYPTAICLSSEIAESVDGNPIGNGNSKRPGSFVFDIFAEDDDNGLAGARQRPAKRRLRDSPSPTGTGEVYAFCYITVTSWWVLREHRPREGTVQRSSRVAGSTNCRRAASIYGFGA